jgi:hypothetical protein
MPNSNGEVFPPRCNLVDKLNALEKEREFLMDMCPKDKQDSYENGKESMLVRILLATLPKEYDGAVKECRSLVRFRKASAEGTLDSLTNLEDNVRRNYSEDWLPTYLELRTELVNEYHLLERRRRGPSCNANTMLSNLARARTTGSRTTWLLWMRAKR